MRTQSKRIIISRKLPPGSMRIGDASGQKISPAPPVVFCPRKYVGTTLISMGLVGWAWLMFCANPSFR